MGSKKFTNEPCVYCGKPNAETKDHIFAKEFFTKSQRHGIPQVPSCQKCNNEKSSLEHYLTAILPFGGNHADATENLTENVPRRVAKNAPLSLKLQSQKQTILVEENNLFVPTLTLPIEPEALVKLFKFIAKGLLWHHWKIRLYDEKEIKVVFPTATDMNYWESHFNLPTPKKIEQNLGNNTVRYEGIQISGNEYFILWSFNLYNGLKLTNSGYKSRVSSENIIVVTRITKINQKTE